MRSDRGQSAAIVWFRQDLRCQDNKALAAAARSHRIIIPLYIANDSPRKTVGEAQSWWLHHSLHSLQETLKNNGLNLCLRRGSPLLIIKALIQQFAVDTVYWNRCYEPESIMRDTEIKQSLRAMGIAVSSFNGSLLKEPWEVLNKSNQYFKVFTPFWKQCVKQIKSPEIYSINEWPISPECDSDSLENWDLLPTKPNWAKEFGLYWEPGEYGAQKKLTVFIKNHLSVYKDSRDIPAQSATSCLSPHLHFGEISPWQLWVSIEKAKCDPACNLASADVFLKELGWREFSYHLLYHFRYLPSVNFKQEFNAFPWHNDQAALDCWQQGKTGFPIVDAGMRELWRTGYMHNRVRMIVASFLVKHLLIDWRVGADWFLSTLLDADLASNSASWQWVAGSGADAAPYFRIFNPILQGEKFDPQGQYIRRWVPELKSVSSAWIHQPWTAPGSLLPIRLGIDYPYPIVEHTVARERALAYYKAIK